MHNNYHLGVYNLMKVKKHINTNYTRQNIKNSIEEKESMRKNKEEITV